MTTLTKMEGLGNTFVVLKGPLSLSPEEVVEYCQQFGKKAADGLLLVTPHNASSVIMKYWNTDGSSAEMCGNGLRCVAKFAVENNLVKPGVFVVSTDVGPLEVVWDGTSEGIEVQVGRAKSGGVIALNEYEFTTVDVGNPHAVTLVESIESAPVTTVGPAVEIDAHFPNKTNVEFVEVVNNDTISVRTWERGSGETLACGTGMVAASLIANEQAKVNYPMTVRVLGGSAKLWVDSAGYTRMLGPARTIL